MIDKIRSVMKTDEMVKTVNKKLTEQNQKINKLSNEIALLREKNALLQKTAKSTNDAQLKSSANFEKLLEKIAEDQKRLHDSVNDFNIRKSNAAQKIVEQLRTDINHFRDVLRTDIRKFDNLKSGMDGVKKDIDSVRLEIKKLSEISSKIKGSDFEMSKYIRKVQDMNNDKLALLKKIDTLERMVGSLRRRS